MDIQNIMSECGLHSQANQEVIWGCNKHDKRGWKLKGKLGERAGPWRVKKECKGPSLVVQWLRIRLLMQETQAQSLVWEDPTRSGATKPMGHDYCACVSRAHKRQLLSLSPGPVNHHERSRHDKKPAHCS